ncbi:hypothetical protein [Nocardia exalbida]|uniref:hypothetical protein n=1 Tax=Nocardia exalbida TaxID=290231 RepID=UPI0002F32871|nr:hypothetical protein [Nocardia exalbida]
MTDEQNFASASVPRHLVRGVVGFGALIGAIALLPVFGMFALLLAPVGLLALRGCPTCWAIGLMQTISRGRLQRSCADGRCRLTGADQLRSGHGTRAPDHVVPAVGGDVRRASHSEDQGVM